MRTSYREHYCIWSYHRAIMGLLQRFAEAIIFYIELCELIISNNACSHQRFHSPSTTFQSYHSMNFRRRMLPYSIILAKYFDSSTYSHHFQMVFVNQSTYIHIFHISYAPILRPMVTLCPVIAMSCCCLLSLLNVVTRLSAHWLRFYGLKVIAPRHTSGWQ